MLMIEHNAVAAEQEAKSSKNDADFTGNNSAILVFVFCESSTGEKKGIASHRVTYVRNFSSACVQYAW